MWHVDCNQSITDNPDLNWLYVLSTSVHRINFFHSNLSTTMGKIKELSEDVRDNWEDCKPAHRQEWATGPSARSLERRRQLLMWLLGNERNRKWVWVTLSFDLYIRSWLMAWGWSWKRCCISPKLHRKSSLVVWRSRFSVTKRTNTELKSCSAYVCTGLSYI